MEQKAGNAFRSIDLPLKLDMLMGDETRYELLCSRLKGLSASVFDIEDGSIKIKLGFQTAVDLTRFWLSYLNGALQQELADVLVTEELKMEHPDAEFTLTLKIDMEEYVAALRQLSDGSQSVTTSKSYNGIRCSLSCQY